MSFETPTPAEKQTQQNFVESEGKEGKEAATVEQSLSSQTTSKDGRRNDNFIDKNDDNPQDTATKEISQSRNSEKMSEANSSLCPEAKEIGQSDVMKISEIGNQLMINVKHNTSNAIKRMQDSFASIPNQISNDNAKNEVIDDTKYIKEIRREDVQKLDKYLRFIAIMVFLIFINLFDLNLGKVHLLFALRASYNLQSSAILNSKEQSLIQNIFKDQKEFRLLYRASRDGFNHSDFHDRCDDKGPTITIIKSLKHYQTFGGYTDIAWSTSENSIEANHKSYLFSIRDDYSIVKMNSVKNSEVHHSSSKYLAAFSGGLYLHRNCHNNTDSQQSSPTYHYERPPINDPNHSYLAGSQFFSCEDIETYQVI